MTRAVVGGASQRRIGRRGPKGKRTNRIAETASNFYFVLRMRMMVTVLSFARQVRLARPQRLT